MKLVVHRSNSGRHEKESGEKFIQHAVQAKNMISGLCVPWQRGRLAYLSYRMQHTDTTASTDSSVSRSSGCLPFEYCMMYRTGTSW